MSEREDFLRELGVPSALGVPCSLMSFSSFMSLEGPFGRGGRSQGTLKGRKGHKRRKGVRDLAADSGLVSRDVFNFYGKVKIIDIKI